jgi:hypothetical protein
MASHVVDEEAPASPWPFVFMSAPLAGTQLRLASSSP